MQGGLPFSADDPWTTDRNAGGLSFSAFDPWTTDGNAGWAALRGWPLSHHKKPKRTVVRIVWAYFCGVQNNSNSWIHMKSGSCVALLGAGRTRGEEGVLTIQGLFLNQWNVLVKFMNILLLVNALFKNHWTAHLNYCISNYLYACIKFLKFIRNILKNLWVYLYYNRKYLVVN